MTETNALARRQEAVERIHAWALERGFAPRFVLCNGKRAIGDFVSDKAGDPISLDEVLDHLRSGDGNGKNVGLVPASLGLLVLDDDSHAPKYKGVQEKPPEGAVVSYKTTSGGWHHVYRYEGEELPGKWALGETRYSHGYVVLWAADALADALEKLFDDCGFLSPGDVPLLGGAPRDDVHRLDEAKRRRPNPGRTVWERYQWERENTPDGARHDAMRLATAKGLRGEKEAGELWAREMSPDRDITAEYKRMADRAWEQWGHEWPAGERRGDELPVAALLNDRFPCPYDLDAPPRKWLVNGWIPMGTVTSIYGRGAVGKSFSMLQLALAVASTDARPFWFRSSVHDLRMPAITASGKVMLVSYEDGPNEIGRRLRQLHGCGRNAESARDSGRIQLFNASGLGPCHETDMRSGRLGITTVGQAVEQAARKTKPTLLVLDPLEAAFGGGENIRKDVRQFVGYWDSLAEELECAVLIVGHPAKASVGEASEYSGSTAWRNAVRSMITMDRRESGETVITRAKGNYSPIDDYDLAIEYSGGSHPKPAEFRAVLPPLKKSKSGSLGSERNREVAEALIEAGLPRPAIVNCLEPSQDGTRVCRRSLDRWAKNNGLEIAAGSRGWESRLTEEQRSLYEASKP